MLCEKHNTHYHSLCVQCNLEINKQMEELLETTFGAGPTDSYYPPGAPAVKDMVNSPAHYTKGDIECIDAIEEAIKQLRGMEAMCTGNAIKYLWRWRYKNGTEDLRKAMWYIQRLIDEPNTN